MKYYQKSFEFMLGISGEFILLSVYFLKFFEFRQWLIISTPNANLYLVEEWIDRGWEVVILELIIFIIYLTKEATKLGILIYDKIKKW